MALSAHRPSAEPARRAPRLWVAAWAVAAALAGPSACAMPERSIAVRHWQLIVDGHAPRGVELPTRLDDVLPAHDLEYRLTTLVLLPDDLGTEPLELTIPHLPAQVSLEADGRSIEPRARHDIAAYRRPGPQHFPLPTELSADGVLALELVISHRWTQSGWLDIAPRIAPRPTGPDLWDRIELVNGPLTLACLVALLAVGLTWLLVYVGDRRRRTYLWFGVQALSASLYPAFVFGALYPVLGRYDAAVMVLGLTSALAASLYFTHSLLSLGPPPRAVLVMLGATALSALAAPGPFALSRLGGRAVVGAVVLVVAYQLLLCARILHTVEHARRRAAWLLFAWLALGLTAWPDLAYWFGLGDFVDGLRPASIGLIVFALLLLLLMSRHHTITLSRSDELNAALTRQIEALEHRQVEIERLNEELRHQVSDRSEQLFVALAAVATGVRAKLPEPGAVLNGRYRVTRPLGEGGMGTVLEVERLSDGVLLAAKLPSESHGLALARLAREAHVASMVVHDNVVRIYDVDFLPGGHLYFVMELADGGTLRDLRAEYTEPQRAAKVLAQVARGLEALHAHGLVHRDVKPSNVVFARSSTGLYAKLTDFGISRPSLGGPASGEHRADGAREEPGEPESPERPARRRSTLPASPMGRRSPHTPPASPESVEDITAMIPGAVVPSASEWSSPKALTMAGEVAGTPTYMAPEIAATPGTFSPPSDVFSFGVLAYELLAGVGPFVEPPALAVTEGREPSPPTPLAACGRPIPDAMIEVVESCLSFDPAARPTAAAVAAALEAIATSE